MAARWDPSAIAVRPVEGTLVGPATRNNDTSPFYGGATLVNGYGGVWARATTVESDIEVLNVDRGAYAGCCLHVLPDG